MKISEIPAKLWVLGILGGVLLSVLIVNAGLDQAGAKVAIGLAQIAIGALALISGVRKWIMVRRPPRYRRDGSAPS